MNNSPVDALLTSLSMIDSHTELLDEQRETLALARRVISDRRFRQEVQQLETDRVGLARKILEAEQIRIDNTPIEDLSLSVRTYNCLKKSGINSLGELSECSNEKLASIRNWGRRCQEEVDGILKK
ncbi:MAG: DNA-directed RNA polymerase subunit alpha C-terminal domain-containing protein [Candidatus Berkelbacteria bacterium]